MPVALITGLTGFTGAYMRDVLEAKGWDVVGTTSYPTDDPAAHLCDITDPAQIKALLEKTKPDYIIHLAAISFVAHSDQEAMYRVNLFGTLNILEAVAELALPVKKILVASSANVYGSNQQEILDESVMPLPVNHYGVSKLATEHMVRTWFDRLPIIMTRPFNYTGVGQADQFIIPKIVSHFVRGDKVIELGNVDVMRDFSDVRFVANAYAGLLESDAQSDIVNICSGTGYALRSAIDHLQELAGYEIEIQVNPAFVRENEIKRLTGSNARLASYVPNLQPISLMDTAGWMYEHGKQSESL